VGVGGRGGEGEGSIPLKEDSTVRGGTFPEEIGKSAQKTGERKRGDGRLSLM